MTNLVDEVFRSHAKQEKKKPFFCLMEVYSFCLPSSVPYFDAAYREEPGKIHEWVILYGD
jgi:hypothetical protein